MNPLFNPAERRLRAPLRLVLQFLVALTGIGLTRVLPLFAIALVLMLTGQIPFSALSSGNQLMLALQEIARGYPVLNWLVWVLAILLILGLYRLLARFLDRRRWQDYGLAVDRVWWYDLGFGLLLGAALFGLIFAAQLALGWISITGSQLNLTGQPFWVMLVSMFLYYGFVSVGEELLARGYMLRNLAEGLNLPRIGPRRALVAAYLLSSLVFGLLHAANPNATLFSTANLALAGLFLGLATLLTGSLAIPLGLHLTWNFFQGNIYGFPVSGGASQLSLIAVQQTGPELWTGGAFGPEGGILGILAMLLGMLLTLLWLRWTRGEVKLASSFAEYTPLPVKKKPASPEAAALPQEL